MHSGSGAGETMGIVGQLMGNSLVNHIHWNACVFKHAGNSYERLVGDGVKPD